MLKLSTKARYGLRAMIELALREGEGPVQLGEIATAQRISPKYLEQLFIPLRTAALIRSERGPKGGYALARPSDQITALDAVRAVEGPLDLIDCIAPSRSCDQASHCVARMLWSDASDAIASVLGRVTLKDLADGQRDMDRSIALSYDI
jgi:Rrf2 family protein